MGRPKRPAGIPGEVWCAQVPGGWRARTTVVDTAGKARWIERTRPTKGAARSAVLDAASKVTAKSATTGVLAPTSPLARAVEIWWEEAKPKLRSQSIVTYRGKVDDHILAPLGEELLGAITVGQLDAHIKRLAAEKPSTAYTVRSLLCGIFDLVVRHDVLDRNLARATAPVKRAQKAVQALAPEQASALLDHLLDCIAPPETPLLHRQAVYVVVVMLATGMRISEVLGLRKCDLALDGDEPRVVSAGIVVPASEGGITWQDETKSGVGIVRRLPPWGAQALQAALNLGLPGGEHDLVFPSSRAGLRRPSAVRGLIAELCVGTEWAGLHSHIFRKTVATTIFGETGDMQAAADQLSHADTRTTARSYVKARTVAPDRTEELAALAPKRPIL